MKIHGQEETRNTTLVDEYIRQLSNLGISLYDLGILGESQIMDEDKNLTERELIEKIIEDSNYKEQKEQIEKYITEFVKADLITQQLHRRRGTELTNKSNGHDDWIDGGIYLYRTKQNGLISTELDTDSEEYVKKVNNTEYVEMQYVTPEEFEELINNKSKKIRYRYTINEETEEIQIAQIKTIETKKTDISNVINSLFTADSTEIEIEKIISIDYKSYIDGYTMPYEFLINLCQITSNPEFVYHVAQLARETNIMLAIQDDTTQEHVTIIEEEKYESYESLISSSTSSASKTSEQTKKMKTEIITTTMIPNLNIEYANTWSYFKNYEYSKIINETTTKSGPNIETFGLPGELPNYTPGGQKEVDSAYGGIQIEYTPDRWSGEFLIEKITTTETKVTTIEYTPPIEKNSIEKSKQFLGLLRNSSGECKHSEKCYEDSNLAEQCAKEAEFNKSGINVKYKIPGSSLTDEPYPKLKSGEQMLYSLLGEGLEGDSSKSIEEDYNSQYKTKMSGIIDHMKYLMSFPENEDITDLIKGLMEEIIGEITGEITDEPLTDEEYEKINVDEVIVKTDESGALRAVTRNELIAVISSTFYGQERENALSIVDTLIDCQEKYKVNAIFVVAFGHIESNIGTANTSHVRNNNWLSWNLGKVYSSPQENVETVMRNVATGTNYFTQGKITIKDIGYTYCPNTSDYPTQGDGWVKNVTAYVLKMYEKLGMKVETDQEQTIKATGKLADVFPNGIPTTREEISKYITTIQVPITTKKGQKTTTRVTVHKAIAEDLIAVLQKAQDAGFKVYEVQGFSWRTISGTSTMSQHSLGLAVDINVYENYCVYPSGKIDAGSFWKPNENEYSIPKNGVLTNAFKSIGWGWGGDWSGKKDYMHFSYTGG